LRTLTRFICGSILFEVIALAVLHFTAANWLIDAIILVAIAFLLYLAVQGWRRQQNLQIPEVMTGKVIRKRHWHLF